MEIITIFAATAGGIILSRMAIRLLLLLIPCGNAINVLASKHFVYSYAISRHALIEPWTRASLFFHLLYIAVTLFLVFFKILSLEMAARRAGTLGLINNAFLTASFCLSNIADLLGISLKNCRRFHRAAGWMMLALVSFHVFIMMTIYGARNLGGNPRSLFATIAAGCLGALLILSVRPLRKICYEGFIRVHQILALVGVYGIWRHIPENFVLRLYIYIAVGVLVCTSCCNLGFVIFRNGLFSGNGFPRAHITCQTRLSGPAQDEGTTDSTPMKICLHLPRPIIVTPGEYIYLYLPSVSLASWIQTHPFMVTSWTRGKQNVLELAVQPRRGLTKSLAHRARLMGPSGFQCMALFSGPYGITESVDRYESVLCVASGLGIAAVGPYVKRLIYGYNTVTLQVRRVHLVWQIESLEFAISMQEMLNDLLTDDVLDDGYILSISVYVENGLLQGHEMPFGKHQRAFLYQGRPDFARIIPEEVSGERIERLQNIRDDRGRALLIASTTAHQRDVLRNIVKGYLEQGLKMIELEYQP